MDLKAELEFQQQQLAQEEQQLAKLQQMLAQAQQQVIFRRGAVAEVERLLAMQEQEQPQEPKEGDVHGA